MTARLRVARLAYAEFHGKDPVRIRRMNEPDPASSGWVLGELVSVVYKRPGERTPYEHDFGKPRPLLWSDPDGRRIYIAGGSYTVRRNGIVG